MPVQEMNVVGEVPLQYRHIHTGASTPTVLPPIHRLVRLLWMAIHQICASMNSPARADLWQLELFEAQCPQYRQNQAWKRDLHKPRVALRVA